MFAVGATIVCDASPSVAFTFVNAPRVGATAPVTFMPKYFPSHGEPTAGAAHEEPEFAVTRVENVGAGVTSVVGGVVLHFHPMVGVVLDSTT